MVKKRKIGKNYVGSKLFKRAMISVIGLPIMIGFIIYEIFLNQINASSAIVGIVLGTIIGLLFFGKMFKIFWNNKVKKIETRFDKIGLIFLLLYIAFVAFCRNWLFSRWLVGVQLYIFGLAFTAGLLSGRILSMIKDIKKILIEENKI